MTGLPASGKTSLGRQLADGLGWPCLDKDDFLETLYNDQPVLDMTMRRRLSQESDVLFRDAAAECHCVVLISHWAPRGGDGSTDTPTGWIGGHFDRVIELHCACPPEIAIRRFCARRRHPSHLDHLRPPHQVERWVRGLTGGYPLGLGQVRSVRSDIPPDIEGLLAQVDAMLAESWSIKTEM
ncbi:AAA family ATPase [Roseovarius sp. 2305UL8-3]|uniref:AAA family ATPase n=1 Tax=Roseovarius conchicola TaxID=3121636 RepID=UPI003526DEE6